MLGGPEVAKAGHFDKTLMPKPQQFFANTKPQKLFSLAAEIDSYVVQIHLLWPNLVNRCSDLNLSEYFLLIS